MVGQTAQGKLDPSHKTKEHKAQTRIVMPHRHLALPIVVKWQRRIIRHDEWVIRTRKLHRTEVVRWHRAQLRWTGRELNQSLSLLRQLSSQYSQQHTSYGLCWSCWDNVATCESHNTWNDNTGNGYYGGLQFDRTTWLGAGGGRYASRADYATREQQIQIASTLPLSRWPVCGARY